MKIKVRSHLNYGRAKSATFPSQHIHSPSSGEVRCLCNNELLIVLMTGNVAALQASEAFSSMGILPARGSKPELDLVSSLLF